MAHPDYYNKDNIKVPSVTTIMKIFYKEGLLEWSNSLGRRGISYTKFMNDRAVLGTRIHTIIEAMVKGEEPLKPLFKTFNDDEVELAINKFKTKGYHVMFEDVRTEVSMSCDDYGGTIDILGSLKTQNGSIYMLGDFKTSKAIHYTQFIQLGGYLNLIKINEPETYDKIQICAIINVNKDDCKIKYVSKEVCETYFTKFFLCLLDAYKIWNDCINNIKLTTFDDN